MGPELTKATVAKRLAIECDGLARRYNTQACHVLPKGHSKRNSCDHVGLTTIPRGK